MSTSSSASAVPALSLFVWFARITSYNVCYTKLLRNIDSLEDLIKASIDNGVELIACSMSMDVMGIKMEELIDGVKQGGVAAMLGNAEESDMSLFI